MGVTGYAATWRGRLTNVARQLGGLSNTRDRNFAGKATAVADTHFSSRWFLRLLLVLVTP